MDHKVIRPFRYRDAVTTSKPGYLARRFKVIKRALRMRAMRNVVQLQTRKA